MNYLTLDLDNGDLVLSDNSVWKSLNTWLDGGTLYSDYYDASNCGDFWIASTHWISIDSESTYLTFTIEYEFIDATATDSCLCQIKFDGFEDGGVAVTADSSGLNISTDASKHINCDYSNANIKIDITVNLLTKEITTYIHKNNEPLAKKVNVSNYSFTEFVIQAGSRGDIVYKLPTTTKLLNVSVSDVAVSYSNFPETIDYIDKLGLARIWANIKSYISSQLLGKSDTGHTHVSSDVTDLLSDTHTWTSQQSYNSDLNLNYASTDVDDIVNSVAGSATLDNFVHMTGNETVSGIKSFPDGIVANVTGSATSATNDGSGNVISTTYGKLGANNTWSGTNYYNRLISFLSDFSIGTAPSADKSGGFNFTNGTTGIGLVDANLLTSGTTYILQQAGNRFTNGALDPNGTWKTANFQVGVRSNGDKFVYTDGLWRSGLFPYVDPGESESYMVLGDSNHQWYNLYAKNYYYNGTAWGLDQNNTWSGSNTYSGTVNIYNSDNTQTTPELSLRNGKTEILSTGNTAGSQGIYFADKNGRTITYVGGMVQSNGCSLRFRTFTKDESNNTIESAVQIASFVNGSKWLAPSEDNAIDLGGSVYRWKSFNGVNPGSLSFPSGGTTENVDWYNVAGDILPTGGNATNFTGGQNFFTPSKDGWLALSVVNCESLAVWINSLNYGLSVVAPNTNENRQLVIPVVAGKQVEIKVKGSRWHYARLIVTQGNV